jgi:hypothetical protein
MKLSLELERVSRLLRIAIQARDNKAAGHFIDEDARTRCMRFMNDRISRLSVERDEVLKKINETPEHNDPRNEW